MLDEAVGMSYVNQEPDVYKVPSKRTSAARNMALASAWAIRR